MDMTTLIERQWPGGEPVEGEENSESAVAFLNCSNNWPLRIGISRAN